MKTMTFFKKALFVVAAIALPLGFASCSDDKDDDKLPPTGTEIVKLPTTIKTTETSDNESNTSTFSYEYNDKNQVTKFTHLRESDKNKTVHTLSYDNKDRVIKLVEDYTRDASTISSSTTLFKYEEEGYVSVYEVHPKWGEFKIRTVKIDEKGFPLDQTVKYEDEEQVLTFKYDQYYNLTYQKTVYTTPNSVRTVEYKETYSTVYSPLANINLPAWLLTFGDELYMAFDPDDAGYVAGLHLPESGTFSEVYTSGETPYTGNAKYVYTVDAKVDNYPTEFSFTTTYEDSYSNEPHSSTVKYTVEYKDLK